MKIFKSCLYFKIQLFLNSSKYIETYTFIIKFKKLVSYKFPFVNFFHQLCFFIVTIYIDYKIINIYIYIQFKSSIFTFF